ncbi:MAG: acyl-CoA thioesterase [Rhodanobacter sp.]|jgi:acyl-CoA thioester hydrolase|nr:acyl-CoA thioesterase [Rhodanobacter sp.]
MSRPESRHASASHAGPDGITPAADAAPLFVASLPVRWRDLDAFNHVNNSTYLTYLEEARLQWLQQVPDWFSAASVPVLAASELHYRKPLVWPAQVQVELRCERLGNSSLTLAHCMVDAGDTDRLYCDGRSVLVWTNPATGKSVPLPTTIRAAVEVGAPG